MDRPTCTLSFKSAVCSTNGMCATSQPLATLAGVEILKSGGSAADAAIGMLNTLAVVEPFMTGFGGDLFGLYFDSAANQLTAINASGPAPAGVDLDTLRTQGRGQMPLYGPSTITVPGALAGLNALYTRYGKTAWADLFQPAIDYARQGFPVSEIVASQWKSSTHLLKTYPQTAGIYLPRGKPRLASDNRN